MSKDSKNYLFICVGKDCDKCGSSRLRKSLKSTLKEQQLHKSVKLIRTMCMDNCKKGPNLIYNNQIFNGDNWKDKDKFISDMIEVISTDISVEK